MSSTSPPSLLNTKKPMRELSSITNHLLITKTLNALANNNNNNNNSQVSTPPPLPSTSSIKENIPNDTNLSQQQKALNLRLAAALKPVDRDHVAALLQYYQTLNNNNSQSNVQNTSLFADNSSSFNNLSILKTQNATKRSTSMTYLCRFNQRNRLIEVPTTSEYYNQQNGISHEHLKQLLMQEFQIPKSTLIIIQIWNDQYQEYIDVESYKKLPFDGRLQILIEKDVISTGNSPSVTSKSPTTPISSSTVTTMTRSITPIQLQTIPSDNHHDEELPSKSSYDEAGSTMSPMHQIDNLPASQHNLMYDLLPKPTDGIPIPRFPPHIAAFLNGNGDANQLNALVQALYQEIVKYELYPNADELRSIVSRLVDRHPNSLSVIGSIELLVRKLYYKFCNERKKYPVELKRRQPNKRKRLTRDDDTMINNIQQGRNSNTIHDLDRLMHLWTTTNDYKDIKIEKIHQEEHEQQHSPSGSSSGSSSPDSKHATNDNRDQWDGCQKYHPLNLSIGNNNNNNLMCSE
ncbi:unnamed protein product [Rotaria sp. Silwood1]|nr:unnamed protein product [Rotaria sp. Silwood1]CAF1206676.1 unnamed protein product [Rotaria sp. Silwood1]CAF3505069.1 unnamed protein product [Rotaria sp. Silwood1]CAF4635294.1 unnamed protein product [Rotaria sp. Silwood1]CAF4848011.1 unnamed protein product [Rotaria sp. Silwood1]